MTRESQKTTQRRKKNMADVNETNVNVQGNEPTEPTTTPNEPTESATTSTTPTDDVAELKAQIQNLTLTNAKLKRANDKLASENGDLNKKYRQKLTEDEAHALDLENERKAQAEREAEKDELIASLQREKVVADATNNYLALGWTSDEASRMAIADADNDTASRMAILKEVSERQKKETDIANLKGRPPVNTGVGSGTTLTKAEFNKMSYSERMKLYNENKALYDQLVAN